ncbi:NfeD family protein [uncultured Methanobrevibacter sp.]|uniref:NfeD family protein n=1 Tax=uncultured Methanobrevibacter sp. TaxID=253161 RepID=UPI00262F3EC6|nr:NfeD family protein [uncultured Methanobrevibacter sp.]
MDIYIWVALMVIFFIMELVTTSFFLVWFGVGSIVAIILNYLGFDQYIQFIGFALSSFILIICTRKFAKKITKNPTKEATPERLIGKRGVVLNKIKDNIVIKVMGEEWSAYSEDILNIGENVEVVGIDSIKLIVKKID